MKYLRSSVLRFSAIFLTAIFGVGLIEAQRQTITKDLPNFYPVNAVLYRGGQPTEAGIKELAKMGVKTIIDLRGADERAKNEDKWAQNAWMKFINKPLNNWRGPKNKQIEEILAEIDKPENQPVFVHCQRGADRTGTVVAVYRMTHDNWTAEEANTEAKKFGFGWWQFWMKDYIFDYYRDLNK